MRGTISLVAAAVCLAGTFTHYGMADNQRRTLFLSFGFVQCTADGIGIVTIDLMTFQPQASYFLPVSSMVTSLSR